MQDVIKQRMAEHMEVVMDIMAEPFLSQVETVVKVIKKALNENHKVMFCGNGGSAADCQHLAAEFVGRF